jgi:uncharacterized protein (TIGR02300 family)
MAKKAAPKEKKSTASAPAAPVKLGEKRACLKCSTKFYDFGKNPIVCPKCHAKMTAEDFASAIPKAEPRRREKPAPVEAKDEEASTDTAADTFESLEDLADSEEDMDIDVDKDDEENY